SRDPMKPSPTFTGTACNIGAISGEPKLSMRQQPGELSLFLLLPTVYCLLFVILTFKMRRRCNQSPRTFVQFQGAQQFRQPHEIYPICESDLAGGTKWDCGQELSVQCARCLAGLSKLPRTPS